MVVNELRAAVLSAGQEIVGPIGDVVSEAVPIAAAGTLAFLWWIIPVGAVVGLFAKPAMKRWTIGTGVVKAAVLGAGLGLITAVLFAHVRNGSTPAETIREFYLLIRLYCAVWCSLYFGWLHRFRKRL
jgi:hypothetical protein